MRGEGDMDGLISKSQRAQVLVQALPYIQRYWNRVVVIKYGGHAMESEELKAQVMEDIVLLQPTQRQLRSCRWSSPARSARAS